MRGYFEPPDIGSEDRDPLVEPDRTSWFCFGRTLLALLFLAIGFAVMMAIGFYFYFKSLPANG
jgi:hypothetical protein